MLAAIATVALAAPPASAKAPPSFFGVAPQSRLESRDFELMAEDNVGMVRQLFLWAAIEPSLGNYDWTVTDDVVRRAAAAGIEVFPVLYGIPSWAQSEKRNNTCGVTCAPGTPAARVGFARFAAAAVDRYGRGGSFWTDPPPPPPDPPPEPPPDPCAVPPLLCTPAAPTTPATPTAVLDETRAAPAGQAIEAWQVWNEQNTPKYYGPRPDVRGYATLLRATEKAIHAEDPAAEVVLGGMWGPPGTDSLVPTQRYLSQLYGVRGARSTFDSLAVHPYAGRLSEVAAQLRGLRKLAKRVGDEKVGMWVTELGWASGGPRREPLVKTPAQQARLLRASYRLLIRKRKAWRVRSVHWYSWRDTGLNAGICAWCPRSGLRSTDGAEKPAAASFRRLAAP